MLVFPISNARLSNVNPESKLSDDCRAIIVGSSVIQCTDVVRDLGVLLDSEMSMQRHISKVRSSQKLAGVITSWTAPGMQNFVAIGSGVSVPQIRDFAVLLG